MNYTSHVFSPPDALSLHDTYSKDRNIFPPKNNGQKNCLWENTSNLNSVIDGFDIWAARTTGERYSNNLSLKVLEDRSHIHVLTHST